MNVLARARLVLSVALAIGLVFGSATLALGVTEYHALLIGNDELVADNDMIENALLNWDCWKDSGTITKKDNRTGQQILADIAAWSAGIDADDVAIFYYGGHGGIRSSFSMDEAPPPVEQEDPVKDNDKNRDNALRAMYVDGIIGTQDEADWDSASDDAVKSALSALAAGRTLVAIFDMCHANENCGGYNDPNALANTVVMNSINEAQGHVIDHGWPTSLSRVLFDTDADGFAQADADTNGEVTVAEWFTAAKGQYSRTPHKCNTLEGAANRPPFKNINNEKTPPGPPGGGDEKQGRDGHGCCSKSDYGDAPDNDQVCFGVVRNYGSPEYNEWEQQWLGPIINGERTDSENSPQPDCSASGDDAAERDDEDGVELLGTTVIVTVSVRYPQPLNYRLDAWWDRNDNGEFENDDVEHVIRSLSDYVEGGLGGRLIDLKGTPEGEPEAEVFTFEVPFESRAYYSRFRLTFGVDDGTVITATSNAPASDGAYHGEVEDYPRMGTGLDEEERSWGTIKSLYR